MLVRGRSRSRRDAKQRKWRARDNVGAQIHFSFCWGAYFNRSQFASDRSAGLAFPCFSISERRLASLYYHRRQSSLRIVQRPRLLMGTRHKPNRFPSGPTIDLRRKPPDDMGSDGLRRSRSLVQLGSEGRPHRLNVDCRPILFASGRPRTAHGAFVLGPCTRCSTVDMSGAAVSSTTAARTGAGAY
jgi:hypothetical protein